MGNNKFMISLDGEKEQKFYTEFTKLYNELIDKLPDCGLLPKRKRKVMNSILASLAGNTTCHIFNKPELFLMMYIIKGYSAKREEDEQKTEILKKITGLIKMCNQTTSPSYDTEKVNNILKEFCLRHIDISNQIIDKMVKEGVDRKVAEKQLFDLNAELRPADEQKE
jgi:hypothetical protein